MEHSIYSKQSGKAYYFNTIDAFLTDEPDYILGQLTRFGTDFGFDDTVEQSKAWQSQIWELQEKLKRSGCSGDIIFEYDIVRMGKRIDVVLLIKHMVFSLEFKNGAKSYEARDAEQAEDYALDLKNFHKESKDLYVCPILVATEAKDYKNNRIDAYSDKQVRLQYANNENLLDRVEEVAKVYGTNEKLDFEKWFNSEYHPTPNIIEAALTAYRGHNVHEIARSEAGQENIDKCEKAVAEIIEKTKNQGGNP